MIFEAETLLGAGGGSEAAKGGGNRRCGEQKVLEKEFLLESGVCMEVKSTGLGVWKELCALGGWTSAGKWRGGNLVL